MILETIMTTQTKKSKPSTSITQTKPSKSNKATNTARIKKQIGLALLKRSQGASLAEIQKTLGWQTHSVRGFLAGTVKKEQGFILNSEKLDNQLRRYRLTVVESE